MSSDPRYVVITPVRDEALYVEKTILSIAAQTALPAEWVIVDDGSTDGTGDILDVYARKFGWLKVVHRKDRGHRAAGGGVIEAFYAGFDALSAKDWQFIAKLDGDLSFEPAYFRKCFAHFASQPKLGIGGGIVCQLDEGRLRIDSQGDPPFHVRGATKIYRRACWDRIAPLLKAPGWDTVDEVKANLHGWTTRTFPDLKVIQHKPTGGADGRWRNWFKNGVANYVTGYHPAFMLAKCAKRAFRKPILLESVALWAGFCSGYFKGMPQVSDPEAIRYLRHEQIRRLLLQRSIYG